MLGAEDCLQGAQTCGEGTTWNAVIQQCVSDDAPAPCGEGTYWDAVNEECAVLMPSDANFDGCVGMIDLLDLLTVFGRVQSQSQNLGSGHAATRLSIRVTITRQFKLVGSVGLQRTCVARTTGTAMRFLLDLVKESGLQHRLAPLQCMVRETQIALAISVPTAMLVMRLGLCLSTDAFTTGTLLMTPVAFARAGGMSQRTENGRF